jgi:BirA family biotin operon repressor/biotin-[acetyl-CoA-carboxylase] ligase
LSDTLSEAAIRTHLGPGWRGLSIVVLERTQSTNDVAQAVFAQEEPGSSVVVTADVQESGRGRRGRVWQSPPGQGLLMSVAFSYPEGVAAPLSEWPLLAVVAVCRALASACGLYPRIKWPNDLVIGGKKVCGILTELCRSRRSPFLVVGCGVNVNTDLTALPEDVRARATSLQAQTGRPHDRNRLCAAIAGSILELYGDTLRGLTFRDVRDEWAEACLTLGRHVRVQQGDVHVEGFAHDIGADGTLWLTLADGSKRAIVSGEIIEDGRDALWPEEPAESKRY